MLEKCVARQWSSNWSKTLQGFVLSPYLFGLIMVNLTLGIWDKVSWYILFAYDIVLVSEMKKLNNKLEPWRKNFETNVLKINKIHGL